MPTITIPQKITRGAELVVLPRKDYENLLRRQVPEFIPSAKEKRELTKARDAYKKGKVMTIHEFRKKLGVTS